MDTGVERIELDITGMTCAACAARIEKKLNRVEGVSANVNYALERASVAVDSVDRSAAELIDVVESLGYGASVRPDHPPREQVVDELTVAERAAEARRLDLRQRLIVATVLAVPVVAMSMVPALQFRNWQWLAFALTWPIAVWGAWPFHRAAWHNLRQRTATMDTLVSLGVVAAFGWSVWALFFGNAGEPGMKMTVTLFAGSSESHAHAMQYDEVYLEVVAAVVVFMLAGRYFESRAKRRSTEALRALLALGAREAAVLRDGREIVVPIDDVRVGDLVVVRPGEKIAADGVVVEGSSAVDNSIVTGESVPAEVAVGDAIIGGAINVGGRIVVRASRVGSDTTLAHMARLVEQAQSGKAPVQRLADRISAVFVPIVIGLSFTTLMVWLAVTGDVDRSFTAAVAVLIIACPCALGLATPTALLVGSTRGAQLGLIIKGPEVLESTRQARTIVLDKTGTVTTGKMTMLALEPGAGIDRDRALWLTASLESASEHPVARAIVAAADRHDLAVPTDFASFAGVGVTGVVDGTAVVAGRPSFVGERLGQLPADLAEIVDHHQQLGRTAIVAGWDGASRAVVIVGDTPKPSSAAAITRLRQLGMRPMLLTGDNETTALAVAEAVGIPAADVIAGVMPREKMERVQSLQRAGEIVAMVGDGVNDAAALMQADLGISLGTGTDVAIEASDLTIVSGDMNGVVDALLLSRRTLATIKVNLFWAFAYNVAALPLAALGLLNPVLAGLAMALSSLFVVSNSLRLRRFQPSR